VPEAATENVAVWPEVIVWLAGCVVIEGIIVCVVCVDEPAPEPLRATEIADPFRRSNARVALYELAAVGVKVTLPERLCPGLSVTGKEGPEYTNCLLERNTPRITNCAGLVFEIVIFAGVLAVPTVCVPKLIWLELTDTPLPMAKTFKANNVASRPALTRSTMECGIFFMRSSC
jgi:hypothetical protein